MPKDWQDSALSFSFSFFRRPHSRRSSSFSARSFSVSRARLIRRRCPLWLGVDVVAHELGVLLARVHAVVLLAPLTRLLKKDAAHFGVSDFERLERCRDANLSDARKADDLSSLDIARPLRRVRAPDAFPR